MSNTRKTLIKLIDECIYSTNGQLADYLIANGVTITKKGLAERLRDELERSKVVIIPDEKSNDYFKGFYDAVTMLWRTK
jgi:hypothetical protein